MIVGNGTKIYVSVVDEILGLAGSRRYLSLDARLYKIAVANWQSSYILQFCSMKTGTVTPSVIL